MGSGEKSERGPFDRAGKAFLFIQRYSTSPGRATHYGGHSTSCSMLLLSMVKPHGKPSALHAGDTETKTV